MRIKHISKTQAINMLIALLIGVFVVFPDVLRYIDKHTYDNISNVEYGVPPVQPGPGNKYNIAPENRFEPSQDSKMRPGPPQDSIVRPGPPQDSKMRPGPPPRREESFKSIIIDLLFFCLLSWGLLLLNNPTRNREERNFIIHSTRTRNVIIIASTFALCYLGIFLNSLIYIDNFALVTPFPWYMNGILIFKGIFIFVSVVLSGQLFNLINRQQNMILENERLKNESLQNRFEALTAQISPHFFFNSLNSLSGLIREKEHEKALKYINEISNMFRYILQGKWKELVPLKEEMHFLKAYLYLLDIKYGKKLTVRIDLSEEDKNSLMLPAMSLQPLVENIIKHNIISKKMPMHIKLYIKENNVLVLENQYHPREENGFSSGIGISNLNNRYKYLVGKSINNYILDNMFAVELPLMEKK